jgi:glycerol-3-phosphate dehydrogenase (NAD(P)+)
VSRIAILGAGSWGTALAILLSRSRHAHELQLWAHDPALSEAMQNVRENRTYLPGLALPSVVRVRGDMARVLRDAEILIGAMPSAHAREVYVAALPFLDPRTAIVSATKGLEPATHLRMTQVLAELGLPKPETRVAVLSGPSFAQEAARGEPTAVVLAATEEKLAERLQEEFAGPTFRLYTNPDVLGVELAGAMKNVIAIAAGACQGIGLGSNSLAALITRGLAEMTRLAVALGAQAETLSGLAGLGDLVLTCTGGLSRNRYVGMELGKGRRLNEILAGMRMVAEGVGTTSALLTLARETGVELPITEQVNAILHQGKSPGAAIRDIMERPQKREAAEPGRQ